MWLGRRLKKVRRQEAEVRRKSLGKNEGRKKNTEINIFFCYFLKRRDPFALLFPNKIFCVLFPAS